MNQNKIEVTKVDVYPFKEGVYIGHMKAIANIDGDRLKSPTSSKSRKADSLVRVY